MKATLPEKSVLKGHNYCGEKELLSTINAVGLVVINGVPEMRTVVTIRVHGTKARNYASVWADARDRGFSFAGHGWAGGYGYHRPSAALSSALDSCGIKLDEAIDGRGERAMEDAARAIATALGYSTVHIVTN